MPVSNYAPEFIEIFRRAGKEAVRIPFDTWREAAHVRFRLNNLRKEMRRERHSLLRIAEGVQISLEPSNPTDKEEPCVLTAQPSDARFLDAIRRAGIEVQEPEEFDTLPLDEGESPPMLTPEAGAAALKRFFGNDKEK